MVTEVSQRTGVPQKSLSVVINTTIFLTLTHSSVAQHPLGISTTADGTHGGGSSLTSGVTYELDGVPKTWTAYKAGFAAASSRRVIFLPSSPGMYYYFCELHASMGGTISVTKATSQAASTSEDADYLMLG